MSKGTLDTSQKGTHCRCGEGDHPPELNIRQTVLETKMFENYSNMALEENLKQECNRKC